jgi:hypothetical protein
MLFLYITNENPTKDIFRAKMMIYSFMAFNLELKNEHPAFLSLSIPGSFSESKLLIPTYNSFQIMYPIASKRKVNTDYELKIKNIFSIFNIN